MARTCKKYDGYLKELEAEAKAKQLGGWRQE
jgi:hypothetical protein